MAKSSLSEIGNQLLPGGALIPDWESGADLFWISPPESDAVSRWLEVNSADGPDGYSAVLMEKSRFDDERGAWWENLGNASTQELEQLSELEPASVMNDQARSYDWELTLAPPGTKTTPESQLRSAIREYGADVRIGFFPVPRPADVPCWTGWYSVNQPYAAIPGYLFNSVILRSWEDRFGARLLKIGQDSMVVAVQRGPDTIDQAKLLASEHLVFDPEGYVDIIAGDPIVDVARAIFEAPVWKFWWD